MTELLFRDALGPQPGGAVELVFGGTATPPVDPPAPVLRPGLIRTSIGMPWRTGTALAPRVIAAPWRAATGLRTAAVLPWQSAAGLRTAAVMAWGVATALRQSTLAPWAASQAAAAAVQLPWRGTTALASAHMLPWRAGAALATLASLPWRTARPAPLHIRAPWAPAVPIRVVASASARSGQRTAAVVRAPWQAGVQVLSIGGPWSPVPVTPPVPVPCYLPDPGNDVLLLLREAAFSLVQLLFACRRAALVVVPIRRVYMIANTTTLTRVSDGAPIACFGFSLSLDRDSWAWGFSASVDAAALPLLQPTVPGEPVELEAMVNGLPFRVIARSIARGRAFNEASVRVDGVGHTAVLDAPFSPKAVFSATSALTAQQLLDQALPVGWTADWQITPWLVPGGLWSHQGTPATAALAIAAAGGAYVQPHASAKSVRVLPIYPVAPWAWAGVTPDLELPAAVTLRESIEWIDRARYNGVYVSGTAAGGVLRLVKRAGTAGDVLAPMVTDRLITHADAARQRGLAVLADTGSQAWVTLNLPVLPATGVIVPGTWVRYVDGALARLGLVRSVRVDVTAGSSDTEPTEVWQSIRVETHES